MRNFVSRIRRKKVSLYATLAIFVLLVLVLPLTVFLARQQQETRQYAATSGSGVDRYGISVGAGQPTLSQIQDMKNNLHAQWVRTDCAWSNVQAGGSSSWDWTSCDGSVNNEVSVGLKPLLVLAYTPAWAIVSGCSGGDKCEPANVQDYINFVNTAVTRYAGKVKAYEIWNEENASTFWQPAPNPAKFTAMLKGAYTAIKAVDPNALVMPGGMTPTYTGSGSYSTVDWVKQLYANGAGGHFDVIATHPYCWANGFNCPTSEADWSAWSQMFWLTKANTPGTNVCSADPCNLHAIMVANGDGGKQIWGTEFGSPTSGWTGGSESEQTNEVNNGYNKFQSYNDPTTGAPWTGVLFWYTYMDNCTDTTYTECNFGLVHTDGSRKQAYAAYQTLAAVVPTATLTPTPVMQSTWRIEAGGTSNYTDSKGNVWIADTGFANGSIVDRGNITIANTTDPKIYQTEHYGMTSASYSVPAGSYMVNLRFAETTGSGVTGAGQRLFDVALNGTTVLSNFDVYAQAGGTNIALIKSFPLTVTNNTVNITFTPHANAAEINGIEILPQTSQTPTPSPLPTNIPTPTLTPTPLPTNTPTPVPPTPTLTPFPTPTNTPVPTNTPTPKPTSTPVPTLTSTPIPTPTPIPPDTTPPTIAITSPLNGALVRHGATTTITASDSDNVGVTRVEFLVNGTLLCINTNPPSSTSCNWPVPGKPGITYTLTARAYDAMGFATSNSIQVRSTQ